MPSIAAISIVAASAEKFGIILLTNDGRCEMADVQKFSGLLSSTASTIIRTTKMPGATTIQKAECSKWLASRPGANRKAMRAIHLHPPLGNRAIRGVSAGCGSEGLIIIASTCFSVQVIVES
jgi:hypothetical protein